MDNFDWRSRGRVIACTDLANTTLELVYAFIIMLLANDGDSTSIFGETSAYNAVILYAIDVTFAFLLVTICINLWAASMVLKAARFEANPRFVLYRASMWRAVYFVLYVFSAIYYGLSGNFEILGIEILLRSGLFCYICKFIRQLVDAFPLPPPIIEFNNAVCAAGVTT